MGVETTYKPGSRLASSRYERFGAPVCPPSPACPAFSRILVFPSVANLALRVQTIPKFQLEDRHVD